MPTHTDIGTYMGELRALICAAFSDSEFARHMFDNMRDFDYAGLPGAYADKVFETVKWAQRFGGDDHVLLLAQTVQRARPRRPEALDLVTKLQALIHPAAVPGNVASGLSNGGEIPPELASPMSLLEQREFTARDLTEAVRPKLREKSYQGFNLPGRCHLSDSEAHRLLAVLALEAEPDATYLRWLSERVSVEHAFVGFTAAQSLISAAMRLGIPEVPRVRSASVVAADHLDALVEADDDIEPTVDSAARKRQLDLAVSIGEIRWKKGRSLMTPADADAVLAALLATFDRDSLDRLCQRHLRTELRWLANLEDPWHVIVASVVITARDKKWEGDLINAAFQEQSAVPIFAQAHQKYGAARG